MVKFHRVTLSLIFDLSTEFTSEFWKPFKNGLFIHAKLSMAYHPKKPMEIRAYYPNFVRYVEFFVDLFNPKWDDHLPLILVCLQ